MAIVDILKSDRHIFREAADEHKAAYEAALQNNTGDAWIHKFLFTYWDNVAEAHNRGKKLFGIGAGFPPELIYAFDAQPLWMDAASIRFSTMDECASFIDLAEKYIPATFCTIDRAMVGGVLSGMFEKPDAMFLPTGPCDSFRQGYGLCADIFEVPIQYVDQPVRIDQRSVEYIAEQYKTTIELLEKYTGTKLNMDRLREVVHRSNQAGALLIALAELRKKTPSPLSGLFLALNEYNYCTWGTQELVDFLMEQYKMAQANIASGAVVTNGPEKHRVLILQNMVWNMTEVLTYMESDLNATLVTGTFEGMHSNIIDETDLNSILFGLAARGFNMPMTHNAGAYAKDWMNDAIRMAKEYHCDCALFLGHVGCKHTWAAARMISDALMKQCGIKTLELDVDSVDRRYQKTEDVCAAVKEFIETVEA